MTFENRLFSLNFYVMLMIQFYLFQRTAMDLNMITGIFTPGLRFHYHICEKRKQRILYYEALDSCVYAVYVKKCVHNVTRRIALNERFQFHTICNTRKPTHKYPHTYSGHTYFTHAVFYPINDENIINFCTVKMVRLLGEPELRLNA
jgi:hypothetical protein